jgi:hypothetical protein
MAVRQALAKTWRTRAAIYSEVEVGPRLYANLLQALEQPREDRGELCPADQRCRVAGGGDGEPTDLRPSH